MYFKFRSVSSKITLQHSIEFKIIVGPRNFCEEDEMRLVNLILSLVFSQHCERGSIRQDRSPILFPSLANRRCSRSRRGRRRGGRSDIELICCCGFGSLFQSVLMGLPPSPFLSLPSFTTSFVLLISATPLQNVVQRR